MATLQTQHLFVDSVVGNDATAILDDPTHPWKTVTGAHNYFIANNLGTTGNHTIYVRAGNYTGEGNLADSYSGATATTVLRYFFEEGAVVAAASGETLFLTGSGVNYRLEVTGWAKFVGANNRPTFRMETANSVYFECLSVSGGIGGFYVGDIKFDLIIKDSLTTTDYGIYLTTGTIINLDLNKVAITPGIEGGATGVYITGNHSVKFNVKINSLTADIGYQNSSTGLFDEFVEINTLTATSIGVLIQTNLDPAPLTTASSVYHIGSITSVTGILVDTRTPLNLNVTVNRIIATGTGYLNQSTNCTENVVLGYVEGATGINLSANNLTVSTGHTTSLNVEHIKASGTGIYLNPYKPLTVQGLISDLQAATGYLNSAPGSSGTINENLTIENLNSQTGISFVGSASTNSNFNITNFTGATGVEIGSSANVILTANINNLKSSAVGYYNHATGSVIETVTINSLNSTGTGIQLVTSSGAFDSNFEINRLECVTGFTASGSVTSKLYLNFGSTVTTNGIYINGPYQVNGQLGRLKSTISALYYNSSQNSNLDYEALEVTGNTAVELVTGTLKLSGDKVISSSGGTGIYISGGNHEFTAGSISGFTNTISNSGNLKVVSDFITGDGATGATGIQILGGVFDGKFGRVTGFDYAIEVKGGSGKHSIIADYVEGRTRSMVIGASGYNPNLTIGGVFVNRATNGSILLLSKCTPSGSTAVQLLAGTVLQAKSAGIAIGLQAAAYGSVLVLLGPVVMNPTTEAPAYITYQNSAYLLNSTSTYF